MGKTQRFGGASHIELGEHHFHPVVQIGSDKTAVAPLIESFEPPVLEAPDHRRGVVCPSILVKKRVFGKRSLEAPAA